jgi:hypothetical protein
MDCSQCVCYRCSNKHNKHDSKDNDYCIGRFEMACAICQGYTPLIQCMYANKKSSHWRYQMGLEDSYGSKK